MTAHEGGRTANLIAVSEIQASYIVANVGDAAIFPPGSQPGGAVPSEFFYRAGYLLTRDRDLQDVLNILARLRSAPGQDDASSDDTRSDDTSTDDARLVGAEFAGHPIPGLSLIRLVFNKHPREDPDAQARIMFTALEAIEQQLGRGKAAPDHLLSISQTPNVVGWCAPTEPAVPANPAPRPAISRSRCDGRGTLVAVVDEGLVLNATVTHPWLQGVTGEPDPQVDEGVSIKRYGGHGTFIASVIRAMAPRADVRVACVFEHAGAAYESDVVRSLLDVLDWAPDVISLSAGTHTWKNGGLLSFHVFVDGPLHECTGTVMVAAAGNDSADWKFSPAEMEAVIGVGALGPPGDARAWFSDYGDWVKVYAPGEDLVHAFANGTYTYEEQNINQPPAVFKGMARWSGTSFSTPIVAGLIAARMSGTGESARESAESLLRLARAQALPGVGPVLRPGQACLCVCEQPCLDRPSHACCDRRS